MKKLLLLFASGLFSFQMFAQLSGVYTLDPGQAISASNFQTFLAFTDSLTLHGVSGPVTLNVKQGTYTEKVTFATYVGTSSANTILVQPDPTNTLPVVVTYSSTVTAEGTITFNAASNIHIDGLTIEATGATYTRTIYFIGSAINKSISVTNCTLNAPTQTTGSTNTSHVYGTSLTFQEGGLTLTNNNLNNNSHSFYLTGTTTNGASTKMNISGNTILDNVGYFIYTSYTDTLIVENNTSISSPSSTAQYGVYCFNGTTLQSKYLSIQKNNIQFNTTSTTYGIYLTYIASTAGMHSIIANNMISEASPGSTSTRYGVYLSSTSYVDILHNSIRYESSSTTLGRMLYITGTTAFPTTNATILNNLFTSFGDAQATYVLTNGQSPTNTIDYNIYYSLNANPFYYGTNLVDLTSWQTASGWDANSYFGDPIYNSPTDLHVSGALGNDSGTNLAGILDDIDGDTRPLSPSTTVDIGADEFAPAACQPVSFVTQTLSTTSSSEITWTPGGTETSWSIEYGPIGFTPGTGTYSVTTTNPTTLSPLTSQTFYDVYVTSMCSATDSSIVTGPTQINTYGLGVYMDWDSSCPSVGFIDISSTGTDLGLADDGEANFTLPFSFYFQGTLKNEIRVGNNGGILFDNPTGNIAYGGNFTTLPDGAFVWGDDLDDETGNVYYETIGTAPNRIVVIHWNNSNNFSGSLTSPTVDFQLQISEATQEIYFVYNDVVFGAPNEVDDYAGNADIGLSGPSQDFTISTNDMNYLQNNSCVHFYYTDCPRPTNFIQTVLTADEIQFGWSAGAANETNWIIEYGTAGFTPGTGTILNTTNNFGNITSLNQLTDYTVYIYANCANGDTSLAISWNFTTLPYCSNPSGITSNTMLDSIDVAWLWTASSPAFPATGFNIQYGTPGFPLYSGTTVLANGVNLADTVYDPALLASGVYEIYVQALCGNTGDTSSFIGPITVVMPLSNDTVCGAENLMVDGTVYTFNNAGATVSLNEASIVPPATGAQTTDGWAAATLQNTIWYKFIAPASGSVRMNNTAIDYNGQAAVYQAGLCNDFNTFQLIAANDNEIGGTSVAPNFTICGLTPGDEYYVMIDGFNTATGNFSVSLTEIVLEAGNALPVTNICTGSTIDLFTTISGQQANGTWSSSIPSVNISITDSILNSAGLAYQTFNLEYRVIDGCAYDSILSQVRIYAPSNAGDDGTISTCRNQPINLLGGINTSVDLNGTWYDPSNIALSSSEIIAANFGGNYNYAYIVGNGVCPDDTANVVVIVNQSCNYLSIEEQVFAGVSVYPNPSTGLVYIDADNTFTFDVTDANGRPISTTNTTITANGTTQVDLSKVERGVYFIRLANDAAHKVYRIVVQ